MLDPLDFENRPFLDALARRRRMTYFVLLLEKISLHFWRPFFWVLLFFGLWMLEIPQFFGTAGKFTAFIAFILGLALFTRRDISKFSFPDQTSIDRRIERQSSFALGHITSIDDKIANPKKHKTRDLWEYFEQQVVKTFLRLKSPRPRALLTRKDPYALRFVAVLFFLSGFWVSGAEWDRRIWEGLMPVPNAIFGTMPNNINLWVKPPEYTGAPQIYITSGDKLETPLAIPEGSEIKVRINSYFGKFAPPTLKMAGNWVPLNYLGEGLYGIETVIEEGGSLRINQLFIPRAKWAYTYVADMPPEIRIATKDSEKDSGTKDDKKKKEPSPPEKKESEQDSTKKIPYDVLPGGQIRFPLVVKDDYAVTNITIKMKLDDMISDRPLGKPFDETRLIMSPPATEFKIDPTYDLAWHTWAGLPVIFEFEAFDHKKQGTKLEPIKLVLPEREFEHPMAKSLIAMRKKLAWNYDEDFLEIAENLDTLLEAPDFFQNDPVVYLAIRTSSARLQLSNGLKPDERQNAAEAIIRLLWDTAISIEDGNLGLAMRDLREAQMALQDALRNPDTPPEEIQRLMDNLREKMANYFLEMQREMQKRMAEGEELPEMLPENFEQFISPDSLAKMMDQMESEMRAGNRESAQEMLSQLQRMMDMMDPSMTMQMPPDMEMMSKGINELQELIEKQEKLKEQTESKAKEKFVEGGEKQHAPQIPRDEKALEELDIGKLPPPPQPHESQKQDKKKPDESGGSGAQKQEPDQSAREGGKGQSPQAGQQEQNGRTEGENGMPGASANEGKQNDTGSGNAKKSDDEQENDLPQADPQDNAQQVPDGSQDETQGESSNGNGGEQKALRYVLGKLMQEAGEKLDEIPESMGEAEQEMRGSEQKLGAEEFSDSIPHQEQAIEKLKESQQQLSKQMQARMQQMVGIGMGGNGQKYDPLGRPYGGEEDLNGKQHGSNVKVPDEAQKKKVEEILRLLRERSGDLERPQEELEYYRRLLRQF